MVDDLHSVHTFVDHAIDFERRHQDELNSAGMALGGALIGSLRAILECENCPGHYRIPIMRDPDNTEKWIAEPPFGSMNDLYCPNCHQFWTRLTP